MDSLNVMLTSIGGSGIVAGIAVFWLKNIVKHKFSKELEGFKSELSRENNTALETLKADLQKNAKKEDRTIEYDQIMDKYRGPLLHAAYDLQSRLFNILEQGLIEVYLVHGKTSEQE